MRFLSLSILFFLSFTSQSTEIAGSFSTAKEWAEKYVYYDSERRISFYCSCKYSKEKVVDQESCGYIPRKPFTNSGQESTKDNKIEWEHVLPAAVMGSHLKCWGPERGDYPKCTRPNGKLRTGRECCQKVNDTFRKAHNDLVNLTPAIGEVNLNRSDHRYGIVEGEPRKYGQCDFEFEDNIPEPAFRIRGDIARIQLYMLDTYSHQLGFLFEPDRLDMLHEWNEDDPVSEWEKLINKRICEKQKTSNRLINECNK